MRLLLIDDDQNKAMQVQTFCNDVYPQHEVVIRRSYQSGLKEVLLNPPDAILLDMTMPTYDVDTKEPGGRERRYAGKEILRQMHRRRISIPTIVITQYEQFEEGGREVTLAELVSNLRHDFSEFYVGSVYYQASTSEWMKELSVLIDTVTKQQAG